MHTSRRSETTAYEPKRLRARSGHSKHTFLRGGNLALKARRAVPVPETTTPRPTSSLNETALEIRASEAILGLGRLPRDRHESGHLPRRSFQATKQRHPTQRCSSQHGGNTSTTACWYNSRAVPACTRGRSPASPRTRAARSAELEGVPGNHRCQYPATPPRDQPGESGSAAGDTHEVTEAPRWINVDQSQITRGWTTRIGWRLYDSKERPNRTQKAKNVPCESHTGYRWTSRGTKRRWLTNTTIVPHFDDTQEATLPTISISVLRGRRG